MTTSGAKSSGAVRPVDYFATTHWSTVLRAGRNDTTQGREALARLCQTYWFPLYAFVRRHGYLPEDAKDLTQGFFERLLQQQTLGNADPRLGRFRSFILGAMSHFLADERAKQQARKRGGSQTILSLDIFAAEQRLEQEPQDECSPEKIFDKRWATALLEVVLNQLADEYRSSGKAELFDALKLTLSGTRETQPYATLASTLSMNEGAVKVAVHRLRKRYRELLHAEIASTVATEREAQEEMRYLIEVLSG